VALEHKTAFHGAREARHKLNIQLVSGTRLEADVLSERPEFGGALIVNGITDGSLGRVVQLE
jgi:hypothetical protein